VVGRQNADIADTLHLRDVAMATSFWLLMGYNFGCMIASYMLFDSGGGFSGTVSAESDSAIVYKQQHHAPSKGPRDRNLLWPSE